VTALNAGMMSIKKPLKLFSFVLRVINRGDFSEYTQKNKRAEILNVQQSEYFQKVAFGGDTFQSFPSGIFRFRANAQKRCDSRKQQKTSDSKMFGRLDWRCFLYENSNNYKQQNG
jgi:hypothetical protein